jgi:hypothetical protein
MLLRDDTTNSTLASRDESGTHMIPRGARDSRLPSPLVEAIERATSDERARSSAHTLLAADFDAADDETTSVDPLVPMSSGGTRLAHAVARTTLDSWRRGEVDCERVAEAYAELAVRVIHAA